MKLTKLTTAEKVVLLMKRLHITQADLAKQLGVGKLRLHYSLKIAGTNETLEKAKSYLETEYKKRGLE